MRPGRFSRTFPLAVIALTLSLCSGGVAAEPRILSLASARPLTGDVGEARDTDVTQQGTRLVFEKYALGQVRISREVLARGPQDGVNHGLWQWFDPQGQLLARGQYFEGQRQGLWQRWLSAPDAPLLAQAPYRDFQPPFLSQADFCAGELHGVWQILDFQGRLVSEIEFADGERHGKATWWYPSGSKMLEMNYLQGHLDGPHITWNSQGSVTARKSYQLGREIRLQTRDFPTGGRQLEESIAMPKLVTATRDQWWNQSLATYRTEGQTAKHGLTRQWHPNGQLLTRGEYDLDEPVGVHTWWYENGQKAGEGEYRMGRREKTWQWWHSNGQLSQQGDYSGGIAIGMWTAWSPEGRIVQQDEAELFARPANPRDTIVTPGVREATQRRPVSTTPRSAAQ